MEVLWADLPRLLRALLVLGLAAALLRLRSGRGALSPPLRRAWQLYTVYHALLLGLQTLSLETLWLLTFLDPGRTPLWNGIRSSFYDEMYLFFAVAGAALPALVLLALARRSWLRTTSLVLLVLAGLATVYFLALGALGDWTTLLNAAGVLGFIRLAGYLAFWTGYLLGDTAPVDRYTLGFQGALTLFFLLVPLQEALFALLGRLEADTIWVVNQSLQVLLTAVQLAIVLRLEARVVRAERAGELVPAH